MDLQAHKSADPPLGCVEFHEQSQEDGQPISISTPASCECETTLVNSHNCILRVGALCRWETSLCTPHTRRHTHHSPRQEARQTQAQKTLDEAVLGSRALVIQFGDHGRRCRSNRRRMLNSDVKAEPPLLSVFAGLHLTTRLRPSKEASKRGSVSDCEFQSSSKKASAGPHLILMTPLALASSLWARGSDDGFIVLPRQRDSSTASLRKHANTSAP